MVKYTFYCPTCQKQNVEYRMEEGLMECDTPVGTIQATEDRAFCAKCGTRLNSRELKNVNSILMCRATMALWRSQNPNGTRKQCRRALGLTEKTVMQFWDNCMKELPKRYEDEETSEE